MKKTGSISLKSTIENIGGGWHHFKVPARVVAHFSGSWPVRLVCTVNDTLRYSCALMSMGDGSGFITISKPKMKELGLKAGDKVSLFLEADTSEYGMEMAEELSVLLEQDEEGKRRFKLLSPGRQRNIIHHVNSVKNPQKRIDRAIMLIESLKTIPEDIKFSFFDILYPEKRNF